MKRIIIIGAGFGGLRLARKLNNHPAFSVLLIDKINHHQFQPLFYQVATAGLDASNISFPIRKIFQESKNVTVRIDEVTAINKQQQFVHTNDAIYPYDYLVIATGATTNFFGNALMQQHALPMKSTIEALQLRYRLIQNFEDLLDQKDETQRARYMNICIVGGGPTGVELAGAIAEMKQYILPKDYPEIDFRAMTIQLFEGSEKTLEAMRPQSSTRSMRYLKELGVTLKTNTKVTAYDGVTLTTNHGEHIPTNIVIWAAGIQGNIVDGLQQESITRGNRILTDELCRVKGEENIYAIGDIACMLTEATPKGHPQVAPVAMQQADMLARNLKALQKRHYDIDTFEYHDKGSMATVGRNLAVVDIPFPSISLGGFMAWMIWMGLHLMLILGVKNRLFIFLNWLYNYFTYDQSLRLIFKATAHNENTRQS